MLYVSHLCQVFFIRNDAHPRRRVVVYAHDVPGNIFILTQQLMLNPRQHVINGNTNTQCA